MCADAEEFVWRLKGIKPQLKLLLLAIAHNCEKRSSSCAPNTNRLSLETGFSTQMIKRYRRELKLCNLVSIDDKASFAGTNIYTIVGLNGKDSAASLVKNELLMSDFDLFWNEYPRKEAKQTALKTWLKLRPTHEDTLKMVAHLDIVCKTEWTKENRKYTPLASSYLNGARWLDELPEDNGVYKGGKNEHLLYL